MKKLLLIIGVFVLSFLSLMFPQSSVLAAGGDKVWEYAVGTLDESSLAVSGGYVYIGLGDVVKLD